jgi:hypothetical protein
VGEAAENYFADLNPQKAKAINIAKLLGWVRKRINF